MPSALAAAFPSAPFARVVVALIAATLAVGLAGAPSLARAAQHAIVRACASDRLPAEILDGQEAQSREPLPLVEATTPAATLRLAVAADAPARELGLMCVLRLRPQHGMIFAFSRESDWEFWMKNTLVPLDMIWIRADGTVTTVAANVPASTRTTPDALLPRRRGRGLYVVEIRAGEAAADGIAPGVHVMLPALRTDR